MHAAPSHWPMYLVILRAILQCYAQLVAFITVLVLLRARRSPYDHYFLMVLDLGHS